MLDIEQHSELQQSLSWLHAAFLAWSAIAAVGVLTALAPRISHRRLPGPRLFTRYYISNRSEPDKRLEHVESDSADEASRLVGEWAFSTLQAN